jgi:hypothetical protein
MYVCMSRCDKEERDNPHGSSHVPTMIKSRRPVCCPQARHNTFSGISIGNLVQTGSTSVRGVKSVLKELLSGVQLIDLAEDTGHRRTL